MRAGCRFGSRVLVVVLGCVVGALVAGGVVGAAKVAENRAYVAAGPGRWGDVFYARCVPAGREGVGGRTEVYRVRAEGDELVDRYEWYAPGGVVLGWSPIKGKVAVMGIMGGGEGKRGDEGAWEGREELRLAIGGEPVASYTGGDLIAMGARVTADSARGRHAGFIVVGCEQVHGTNEYDFVVEVGEGARLRFDVTTGRVRDGKGGREQR